MFCIFRIFFYHVGDNIMEEHSNFWFVIIYLTGLCFLGAIIYMGALIVFGSHDPETINNFKDCLASDIPPDVCDMIYPPINIQSVNWSIPFP